MADEKMKIRIHHERPAGHEAKHGHEHHRGAEKPAHKPEHAVKHEQHLKAEHARHKAAHEAVSARETPVEQQDKNYQPKQAFVNKELKEMAYERTLTRIRRQLSPLGRLTSKIVHQPAVNAVSEAAGKTVGRPSGLLGAGFMAFVGTSIYYYIARHYGYEYNFTAFLVLILAGLIIGWFAEVLYRTLRTSK